MSECPIFNAFSAAESIWKEIDKVVNSVPEAFASSRLVPKYKTNQGIDDADWASSRTGYLFEVTGAVRRQRKPSEFLLMFDLCRPLIRNSWPHCQQALLTFAFSARYDSGWEVRQTPIGMDEMINAEARAACVQRAEGRMLEWPVKGLHWNEKEWLFSVPLMKLDGHAAFTRNIVNPIRALLERDETPDAALRECSAITFAQNAA